MIKKFKDDANGTLQAINSETWYGILDIEEKKKAFQTIFKLFIGISVLKHFFKRIAFLRFLSSNIMQKN